MLSGGGPHDFHKKKKSLHHNIKDHDDDAKFFSRLVSKESSVPNPSSTSRGVYYGDVSDAVPFTWETRPGTPKHTFSDSTARLPPLTPPPSYFYISHSSSTTALNNKSKLQPPPTSKRLRSLLTCSMISLTKLQSQYLTTASSSLSSLSRSSSYSSSSSSSGFAMTPSSFTGPRGRRSRPFSSWGSSLDDDHLQMPGGSPNNNSCSFCFPHVTRNSINSHANGGGGGGNSVKKNPFSVIGCGSR